MGFDLLPPGNATAGQKTGLSLVGLFPCPAVRRAASRILSLLVFVLAVAVSPAAFASVSGNTEKPDLLLDPPVEPTPVLFAIDRVLLAMSALIAAVAFNFVIASSLPRISYLTWLDGFVILAYVAIFATLVLHTVFGALDRRGLAGATVRLDRWSQILFPVIYLLMVLLFFL